MQNFTFNSLTGHRREAVPTGEDVVTVADILFPGARMVYLGIAE